MPGTGGQYCKGNKHRKVRNASFSSYMEVTKCQPEGKLEVTKGKKVEGQGREEKIGFYQYAQGAHIQM